MICLMFNIEVYFSKFVVISSSINILVSDNYYMYDIMIKIFIKL